MPKAGRAALALVVAVGVLAVMAWLDTTVVREALQRGRPTFELGQYTLLRALGSFATAAAVVLLALLAWGSRSVAVGMIYLVVGAFVALLPWIAHTFATSHNDVPALMPDAFARAVFDLYVANNDRAFGPVRRNLILDGRGQLVLIDQGNACFYRRRREAGIEPGTARLDAVAADLRALFDMDHKGNLYRQLVTRWDLVQSWCGRIERLPDYVIDAAIARIPHDLTRPTPDERAALRAFLLDRRARLLGQIAANPAMFPNLPPKMEA